MKNIDIKLYKLEVIKGKEAVAREWLTFLKNSAEEGVETLKAEKVYLESYFTAVESDVMYVYLFIAGNDIEAANNTAYESRNPLDLKHFKYMKSCIDLTAGDIMDCFCYIENLSDVNV